MGLRKRGRRRQEPGGFVLLLALGGAMVLVLGSLSLQLLALQSGAPWRTSERLRRAEDELASAAHHLVAELNAEGRCLLGEPLERWREAGCAAGDAFMADRALVEPPLGDPPLRYRLLGWRPRPDGGAAELELELLEGDEGPAGAPPWRAAFAVGLASGADGQPLVVDVRPLGLQGVAG